MYLFMRPCLLGCKTDKCRISAHPSHRSLVTQCGIACEEHTGRCRLRRCIQADPSEFGPQGEEGVYQPGEMGDGLGRKPSFHKSREKSAEWGGCGASLATAQSVSLGQGSLCLQEPAAPTLADRPWGPPPPSLHRWPHLTQVSLGLSLALSFLLTLPDPDMWCPLGFCSVSGRRIHLLIRVLQHPDMHPGYRLPGTQQELSEGKVYFRYSPQVPLPTQRHSPGMFL